MLRLQTLKTAPDTPPSVLVPLTRPEFMSPVAEASFETSSINTPATFTSTPAPAQRQNSRALGVDLSPSTPVRSPLGTSRRQLDGNGNGRTASPSSGGIKRSNTIHNFNSPSPLQGASLARSTNQSLKQVSNIPLGKTVTMKNFQGALGLHAARAASPSAASTSRTPARTAGSSPFASGTFASGAAARQSTGSAAQRIINNNATLSRIRAKLDRTSKPKESRGPPIVNSPVDYQRSLRSSRSERASPIQTRSMNASPFLNRRNLPAYVEEDAREEPGSGSTPPGWTLVQTPAVENVAEHSTQGQDYLTDDASEDPSGLGKGLPARSRIPSSLGASVGPKGRIRQQIGRAVSRVSSAGTTATSSSISGGTRPQTPSHLQRGPTPTIETADERPQSSISNRPPSSLSNRPESRTKVRPPLPSGLSRPGDTLSTRPASAQSTRNEVQQTAATRSRRAVGPADRPRPISMAGSPSAPPPRPITPSSARPHSRNELSRSMMSPGKASARHQAPSMIPESPIRAARLAEDTGTPGSALTRSHRRVSLNEATPSRLPRRSLSGRPTPTEVAKARAQAPPPVPVLSQEHQREAALRRTTGNIGLGHPPRPSSRI